MAPDAEYAPKATCEMRDECNLPIVREGVQVEASRSTLDIPCSHEVLGTLIDCPKRRKMALGMMRSVGEVRRLRGGSDE